MTCFKLKNKFIVIIAVCNAQEFISESINSVFSQDFDDVGVIIRDDLSTDETPQIISQLIGIEGRRDIYSRVNGKDVIFIRNTSKLYGGGNTFDSATRFVESGESIIGVVDGDDYLIDHTALSKIYKVYENNDLWQVWSQHYLQSLGQMPGFFGHSNKLPPDECIYNSRNYWSVSHFRTCKQWLFSKINLNDLADPFFDEPFCRVAGDAAFIYPITELCGNHKSYFLDEPLYFYRDNLPSNDHNFSQQTVQRYSDLIRQKDRYDPFRFI